MPKIEHGTQARAKVVTHSHPAPKTFVAIGAVLFVITAVEYGILKVSALAGFMVPLLAFLSVVKFFLVVAYFMHLKWDGKLLAWCFSVGVILATAIAVAQKYVNLA
jgi:cytochrome c oxidase subunit IV